MGWGEAGRGMRKDHSQLFLLMRPKPGQRGNNLADPRGSLENWEKLWPGKGELQSQLPTPHPPRRVALK